MVYAEAPMLEWEHNIGDDGMDISFSHVARPEGGYALACLIKPRGADHGDLYLVFTDSMGRVHMFCYGFGWQGTYAAGKYFDRVIYPDIDEYKCSWIIVKWGDTNSDGFVNAPGDGDLYTEIATG